MITLNSDNERTWITCASYAMLELIQNIDIDLIEFENSTGVTFGVASHSDQYHCTRMLTPYRKFWDGIRCIEKIWGLEIEHICTDNKKDLLKYISSFKNASIILGPISMAALYYLPMCSQYRCADHYVGLHINNGKMYLSDSEGVPYMRVDSNDLQRITDISDIMESDGMYQAGIVEQHISPLPPEERTYMILDHAGLCYRSAEEEGQGGNAFMICQEVMRNLSVAHWETSLRYDLCYYLQRKYMLLKADPEGIYMRSSFKEHISFQISFIRQTIYQLCQKEYKDVIQNFSVLAEAETMIAFRWKELTSKL